MMPPVAVLIRFFVMYMMLVPVLLFVGVFQRQLIRGLTMGAVK